jgi:hypothetical protein
MSWQRPFKELNPHVQELIVKVLEEGKGAGQNPEWQTLGNVARLDCHIPSVYVAGLTSITRFAKWSLRAGRSWRISRCAAASKREGLVPLHGIV